MKMNTLRFLGISLLTVTFLAATPTLSAGCPCKKRPQKTMTKAIQNPESHTRKCRDCSGKK